MARGNRSGRRPRYQWIRELSNSQEITNGTTVTQLSVTDAEIIAEGLAAPTVVRIRGSVLLTLDTATTGASETQGFAMGIIAVKSSVTGAEVGGPLTTPNLEWMYWRGSQLTANTVITSTGVSADAGHIRYDFDVKAMRKLHKSSIHMIVENAGQSDAHVFCAAHWSVLFQE